MPDTAIAPDTTTAPPATDTPVTTQPNSGTTPAGGSPLLVTSAGSRAQYATNETNLNSTLNNVSSNMKSFTYQDNQGNTQTISAATPEEAIAKAPNIDPHSGVQVVPPTGGDGSGGTKEAGGAGAGAGGTGTGTTPADQAEQDAQAQVEQLSTLPPEVASQFKGTLDQQDQNIANAKDTLSSVIATLSNDPAAQQAAAAIAAKYSVLINAMKEKNRQILGGFTENAARNGSLQYANDMESTFMSNEMDRASQRIATLVNQEQELILKSNTAYKNGDIKAFNAAQSALTKATADKTSTLGKLLTATNAHVKSVQAQMKLDQSTKQNQIKNDVTLAKSTAAEIVDEIRKSGVTDPAEIKKYIHDMAERAGISDPTILESAVVTAGQTADKVKASLRNTNSIIAKRGQGGGGSGGKGGTDGAFKYSGDDTARLANLLNHGTSDGTFAGRGADGYVDPGAYVHAFTSWIKAGGTPKGFLKQAPISNVNPTAIPTLPAAIQPKTATQTNKYQVSAPTK